MTSINKNQINKFLEEFENLKLEGGSMFQRKMRGGIWTEDRLSKTILQKLAAAAYKPNPDVSLTNNERSESLRLAQKYPNMYIYKNLRAFNQYVVAIRGTSTLQDVGADILSVFGQLHRSSRYKRDLEDIKNFLHRQPNAKLILVGHSLGGGIIRKFQQDKDIKPHILYSLSYNPSYEITDVFKPANKDQTQHEIYSREDPLYKIREVVQPEIKANENIEIRKEEEDKNLIQAHSIDNPTLEGGKFRIPEEIKQKFLDMKPSIYKNVLMIKEMKKNKKYAKLLKGVRADNKINQWMDEQWVNVKDYLNNKITTCGRQNKSDKPYPVCRALKRINETTPITLPELLKKGAKNKLIKAIKQKEQNPNIRIQFKKMV